VHASWQPLENYEKTCGSLAILVKAFAQGANVNAVNSNGDGTATIECNTLADAQKLLDLGTFSPDGGATTVDFSEFIASAAGYSLAAVKASWQPPEKYEATCDSLAILVKAFAQGATITALKSNGDGTATIECDTRDDAQKLLALGKFSPDGGPTTVVFSKLLASTAGSSAYDEV
jgi:hypothetical protein